MAQFMPYDPSKAEKLNERLGKTIFGNVSTFVSHYNSGLINRSHEEVAYIASEITKTYRDVKSRGNRLIFISEAEVHMNEIYNTLNMWEIIIKVKRDLDQHVHDGDITENDTVLFSGDSVGYALTTNDAGELERLSAEKLFTKPGAIGEIYAKYSSRKDPDLSGQGTYQFAVSDLTSLDDSFITRIQELLPR